MDRYYRLAFSFLAVVTVVLAMALVRLLSDRTLYVIRFPWILLSGGGQLAAALLLMTLNLAALWAVSTAYFYVGSFPEEEKLLEEFGLAYRDYQRRVPRLVPRPWRRYRPGPAA